MRNLEPPDLHHFKAAMGWLELGNPTEARAELEKLSPANRSHPEALQFSWNLSAREKNWSRAMEAARELVKAAPFDVTGWIHQSYALHELGRTREAYDLLLPGFSLFPGVSTVPYNLSCYACQLGELQLALSWLDKAIQAGGREEIKNLALADADLRTLWEEIAGL